MEKMTIKKKWIEKLFPLLIVIILFSLFFIAFFIYIQKDVFIPFPDSQHHILLSTRFYRYIFYHSENPLFPKSQYPPVPHIITAFFYKLFGRSLAVAKCSMLFFVAVFLFSLYGIGNHYGGKKAAIVLTAMGAGSPWVMIFSDQYYPDFPSAAFAALTFYLILRSNFFKDDKMSLLAGLSLAVAFLCKWSAILVVILPLLWFIAPSVIRSWKTGLAFFICVIFTGLFAGITLRIIFTSDQLYEYVNFIGKYIVYYVLPLGIFLTLSYLKSNRYLSLFKQSERESALSILNFTRSIAIAFLAVAPWIFQSSFHLHQKFVRDFQAPPALQDYTTMEIITKLLAIISSSFSYLVYFILAGLIFTFIYKENLYEKLIIPINVFVTAFIILKIAEPTARYFIIWLPFTLTLGSYWVCNIKNRKIQNSIVAFVLILSILSMYGTWLFPEKANRFIEKISYPILLREGKFSFLNVLYKPLSVEEKEVLKATILDWEPFSVVSGTFKLDAAAEYIIKNIFKIPRIQFVDPGDFLWKYLRGSHLETEIFYKGGNVTVIQSPPELSEGAALREARVLVIAFVDKGSLKNYGKIAAKRIIRAHGRLPSNDKTFDIGRDVKLRVLIF